MATVEERVETLETQMADVQAEASTHPTLSAVRQYFDTIQTSIETNASEHTSYEQRLNMLERYATQIRSLLSSLNATGVALKRNLTATIAPTALNDDSEGYSVGSDWVIIGGDYYVCVQSTTNAAVWKKLSI